jgi:hypothetical protein
MEKLLINISKVLDCKEVDTKEEMMSNIIKLMQDYNIREKTDSPIDHLSADDVFRNIYADTVSDTVGDLDRQVDDYTRYANNNSNATDEFVKEMVAETVPRIEKLTSMCKSLMEFYVGSFACGPDEIKWCAKYEVVDTRE